MSIITKYFFRRNKTLQNLNKSFIKRPNKIFVDHLHIDTFRDHIHSQVTSKANIFDKIDRVVGLIKPK